jgi:hypothetical protein
MTAPLDPETKRLRALSTAELADQVGETKAQLADLEALLDRYKAEGVRRELTLAEGRLFRVTWSEPGTRQLVDAKLLRQVMGEAFADHFSKQSPTDWVMRCSARTAPTAAAVAA